MEEKNKWLNPFFAFISYFFIMIIFSNIIYLVLLNGIIPGELNDEYYLLRNIITNFTSYTLIIIIFIILLKNFYQNEFRKFKEKAVFCILVGLGGWIGMILLNIILNIILNIAGTSENQQAIEMMFDYPLLIIPMVVIGAPIIEETVFRGIIFRSIKNLKLPYKLNLIFAFILSSSLFGLIHVLSAFLTTNDVNELILGIPYIAMGFMLTLVYYITNNIYASIFTHFLQNTLATIAILLMKLFQDFIPSDSLTVVYKVVLTILHLK